MSDILTLAQARAGSSTHLYEFGWPTPVADIRAGHAVELPFVFDKLVSGAVQQLHADGKVVRPGDRKKKAAAPPSGSAAAE